MMPILTIIDTPKTKVLNAVLKNNHRLSINAKAIPEMGPSIIATSIAPITTAAELDNKP